MKAFVLKSKGEIGFTEKEKPVVKETHGVLLRPILVSPCTSDVHTIWQGSPKKPNLTLGHECIAEIVEVGEDVKDFKVGDIVAVSAITPDWSQPDVMENPGHAGQNFSGHSIGKSIDGAFQELFYLPYGDKNLGHIPEGMSLEDALMCVDVMQTGFTAVEEAAVKEGQTVVVMGIGGIGLAAILGCKLRGVKQVFAIGSSPENVKIAEAMGDSKTQVTVINYKNCRAELPKGMHPLANSTGAAFVNEVLMKTNCKGADAVLICGGSDLSLPQAVDMVKYGTGIVSNVMYYGADPEMQEMQEAHKGIDGIMIPKFSMGRGMAGKTLKFSLSRGGREHLEKLMREIQAAGLHPGVFITKRYRGLDKIETALYDMKDRKAIKIAVEL